MISKDCLNHKVIPPKAIQVMMMIPVAMMIPVVTLTAPLTATLTSLIAHQIHLKTGYINYQVVVTNPNLAGMITIITNHHNKPQQQQQQQQQPTTTTCFIVAMTRQIPTLMAIFRGQQVR